MGSEKKIRTGYILIVLFLTMTLLLSVFLVFAFNEDLPMLKSTGAGLLGFGKEETFTTRGGAIKLARPDYFSNIYEFSDGDTFVVVGWIVRLIYWVFYALGICVLVNAGVAYFSKQEKLGKALTFLLGEIYFGFAIVVIALISTGYPSLLFRSYTYSTQYYFLLIPLAGALVAALLTKKEFKVATVTQTQDGAYPASQSVPASAFCTKCGNPIPQGAGFCVYCGGETKGDVISASEKLPANAAAPVRQPAAVRENKKPLSILDKYRLGLCYLDECGAFDESKFREFNRIAGNQFSDADIAKQLGNARMMLRGMDDLKQTLRATMIEAIQTFEELERRGIDLSMYNI